MAWHSPPTILSQYEDLNQHGTETVNIPAGSAPGYFSFNLTYTGDLRVTQEQCVILYVDNLRVR